MTVIPDTSEDLVAQDEPVIFTVTDLKQFAYCPRVFFFEQCLPRIRPRTGNMDVGKEEHEDEKERAVRRTIRRYDEEGGKRELDVRLYSSRLHLSGLLDELIITAQGELIPVDYKLAERVGKNHQLQLTAYALLLEEAHGKRVERGAIYLIGKRKQESIKITPALRTTAERLLTAMFATLVHERMPEPVSEPAKCGGCEFRRFCNDVD
jgi:CRISPR-associated exonuclease Cas4